MNSQLMQMEPGVPIEIKRIEATIKWFNPEKGFGFVAPADGSSDVFLHFSILELAGRRRIFSGDAVTCDIAESPKGRQVVRIVDVRPNLSDCNISNLPFINRGYNNPTVPLEDMEGEVKWFNTIKGFGFAHPDDQGRDVFIHISLLRRLGFDTLEPGQRLNMKVLTTERGREAREFKLI